jgi:hypothetical protein
MGKLRGIGSAPFGRSYLRFLGLYWITAPLAWLYAIPVETFMGSYQATLSNLALLGVVSVWRVSLMARVVQTLFNMTGLAAWSVVLLFADTVALVAIAVTPIPVISMMGGISHTDAEIAILNLTIMVGFACLVSLPVWLLSTAGVAFQGAIHGARWEFALAESKLQPRPTTGLRLFAAGAVGAWAVVLPITQPKQHLAYRVNHDLKTGKINEAMREMASHDRSDFPARWDPPPHIGYGEREPPIVDVMEALLAVDAPTSIRAIFTEKFGNTLYNTSFLSPENMDDKELVRYVNVLLQLPEGPSFASGKQGFIQIAYGHPENSEARRAALKALLDLAKTYDPTRNPSEHFARSY